MSIILVIIVLTIIFILSLVVFTWLKGASCIDAFLEENRIDREIKL